MYIKINNTFDEVNFKFDIETSLIKLNAKFLSMCKYVCPTISQYP